LSWLSPGPIAAGAAGAAGADAASDGVELAGAWLWGAGAVVGAGVAAPAQADATSAIPPTIATTG